MIIGYWTREDKLLRNNYFSNDNNPIDLDENIIQSWWRSFAREAKKKNILINNLNLIKDHSNLDVVIFSDYPGKKTN